MAWGPNERKNTRRIRLKRDLDAGQGSTCRKQGHIPGFRRRERVRIELRRASCSPIDRIKVALAVDTKQFGARRYSGLDETAAAFLEAGRHRLHDRCALDALGMSRGIQMIREAVGRDDGQ
jgi:hypothetical protein